MSQQNGSSRGVVLFDRDGTLVHDVPYNGDPDRVVPVDGALEALAMLRAAGLAIGIVSNQGGVARGLITTSQVRAVNARVEELLGPFDVIEWCEHGPDDGCGCRKPRGGLIERACGRLGIPMSQAVVVGDIGSDVQAALSVGARAVLVPTTDTLADEVEAARRDDRVIVASHLVPAARAILQDGLGAGRVSRLTTRKALDQSTGDVAERHAQELVDAVQSNLPALQRAQVWGESLAEAFLRGNRLLVAGNGGSAAQAAHLAAEFVGRFMGDRQPLPAVALPADMAGVTAIGNDYGFDEVLARPVAALARERDVVLLMSTSGRSPNVLAAVTAARRAGASVWAMTGPAPNPLADVADDVMAVDAPSTALVQEVHMAALHVIAESVDLVVARAGASNASGSSDDATAGAPAVLDLTDSRDGARLGTHPS